MSHTKEVREIMLSTEIKHPCCARLELDTMERLLTGKDGGEAVNGRLAALKKKAQAAPVTELSQCCKKTLLKTYFQLKGTISDPSVVRPFIEIYFDDEETAKKYRALLLEFQITSGISIRRNKYLLYIKYFDGICDFLTLTGAQSETIKFFVEKAERETINNANRATNCDIANLNKAVKTAEKETEAIEKLKTKGKYNDLPEDVKEVCELRLNNPDASQKELASLMVPKRSRTYVSVKLKKAIEESL